MAYAIPSWLVLLAAFNQQLTGIPWIVGVSLATIFTAAVVVIVDRRAEAGRPHGRLGPFGRAILTWGIAFGISAIVMSAAGGGDSALILVPFVAATFVTAAIELSRHALRGRAR